VQPVASPTAVTDTQGGAQTLPVVATAGDPLVPLDPAATRLEAPVSATVDVDGTVLVVPGEGRYELDRSASTVAFKLESIGNDCACAFLGSVVNRQLGRSERCFRFRLGVRVLSWVSRVRNSEAEPVLVPDVPQSAP